MSIGCYAGLDHAHGAISYEQYVNVVSILFREMFTAPTSDSCTTDVLSEPYGSKLGFSYPKIMVEGVIRRNVDLEMKITNLLLPRAKTIFSRQ